MADAHDTGQLVTSAAQVYDRFFVPALFDAWPPRILDLLAVGPGDRLVDVACGTGVAARHASARGADVVGLDLNEGMLAVARTRNPGLTWVQGDAGALPFSDAEFNAAICQFGWMFFADRAGAIRELRRVVGPQGRLAIAVWGPLDETPGYVAMAALIGALFGEDAARSLHQPYAFGDEALLRAELDAAGESDATIHSLRGEVVFPSLDDWVHTDIKGWTLADVIDDEGFERLRTAAHQRLTRFVQPDGRVRFPTTVRVMLG